jgi:hypothetical protein
MEIMLQQSLRPIPAFGPPPDDAKTLPVPCVLQGSALNWCWAACAEMVLRFYKRPDACRCKAANFLLNLQCCTSPSAGDCSPPPPPSNCDMPCCLPDICAIYNHFGVTCTGPVGIISFDDLRDEIRLDRPVQVLYTWGSTQHVAVVVGFMIRAGKRRVVVNDPWYKCTDWAFSSLLAAYNIGGSWVRTWKGLKP